MIEDTFNRLNNYIGQEVTCEYYFGDTKNRMTAELKEVINYKAIRIKHSYIPFIGPSVGIKLIRSLDGKLLYNNPYLKEEKFALTTDELEAMKIKVFGEDYKEKLKNYHIKRMTLVPKNVK